MQMLVVQFRMKNKKKKKGKKKSKNLEPQLPEETKTAALVNMLDRVTTCTHCRQQAVLFPVTPTLTDWDCIIHKPYQRTFSWFGIV